MKYTFEVQKIDSVGAGTYRATHGDIHGYAQSPLYAMKAIIEKLLLLERDGDIEVTYRYIKK